MPYSEHSVARRLLNNDSEALGQVIRWISMALASPRFWHLRREWPDLVQEVLARVVESLRRERFDDSRDLRVYVQGIARFACLQALAKQMESANRGNPGESPQTGAPDPVKRLIDFQRVRRVLDLASEDCQELFRLYYFDAQNYEEIATSMGIPVGTVKSRLYRCLESAHQALKLEAFRNRNAPR
ncbi:MAG: sigma-70 family RNA polymerase sigma factor [Acidobacteria bacterium]|nr:sigma-70 family RNA polymerase sigma factor [Acidobacteriota bacterium]